MSKRTIGHDSEFGLSRGGKIISALNVLERVDMEEGSFFPDNMNCEIAITPVTTLKEFHRKTETLLGAVKDMGFDLLFDPVITYPDKFLDHPEAKIAGCLPDFSAYMMEQNIAPDLAADGKRSCGAHVHASLDDGNPYWFARWMDMYVALPLLQYESKSDRRAMYGAPGCLRVKPYGGEYRTLSNFWVHRKELRERVWEGTMKAAEKSKDSDPTDVSCWPEVYRAIMTHDLPLAADTMEALKQEGVYVT
jgi:hypothetical protein